METKEEPICCPPFDPAPWDEKTHVWTNKMFIKDRVCTFFYVPLNFSRVMIRTDKLIRASGGNVPDYLALSEHTSKWNMDIYIAVDKEIKGARNTTFNGIFASKVYEGPFKDSGKWQQDFSIWCKNKDYKPLRRFMFYTTCPKCAKKYGKNYVVLIAQIEK